MRISLGSLSLCRGNVRHNQGNEGRVFLARVRRAASPIPPDPLYPLPLDTEVEECELTEPDLARPTGRCSSSRTATSDYGASGAGRWSSFGDGAGLRGCLVSCPALTSRRCPQH